MIGEDGFEFDANEMVNETQTSPPIQPHTTTPSSAVMETKMASLTVTKTVKQNSKVEPRHECKTEPKPSDDNEEEFNIYAIGVEKGIQMERALTQMRLSYIHRLRPVPQQTNALVNMVNLNLPAAEDMTDSDSSILLSAIQDGALCLIEQFLADLEPQRVQDLLQSRVGARGGMSFLQIALVHGNYEIFRELRFNMDNKTKRFTAELKDDLGDTLLHHACRLGSLLSVQGILANYSVEERQYIIMEGNNKGDNCLATSVFNSNPEVFKFLLRQFTSDELLWRCIRRVNSAGFTVGHTIVGLSTKNSNKLLQSLVVVVKRVGKPEEFLFQPGCSVTLLHTLVTASTLDYEEEGNVITNLAMLMSLVKSTDIKSRLLWMKEEGNKIDPLRPTALYRLASFQDMNQTRICDHLLTILNQKQRIDYIMAKEVTTEQNALHSAARANNFNVLRCLLKHIPSQRQTQCLSVGCKLGNTPMHVAAADCTSLLAFKEIIRHLSAEERKQLVMTKENHGNTSVLVAFIEGNIALVNMLLREDWMPRRMIFPMMSARNCYGWTIIHLSCMRLVGDSLTDSVLRFLKDFPGVNLRALINHVDTNGNTVLHLAALLFRPKVITSVLENLHQSERKRFLEKTNKDGLRASQLCNMPDLAVVHYLHGLSKIGWSDAALIAKRDYHINKMATRRALKAAEVKHGIRQTLDDGESSEVEGDEWLIPEI